MVLPSRWSALSGVVTRSKGKQPIILLNYSVDAARRSRHLAAMSPELRGPPYVLADSLARSDDAARVRVVVNKTRELSAVTLERFPQLKGIGLHTVEAWV